MNFKFGSYLKQKEESCIFDEIKEAREQRDMALVNFNECTEEWSEVCWLEYQKAEKRVEILLKEVRRKNTDAR